MEPMGGSVGGGIYIFTSQGFFSGAGKAYVPVWDISAIVLEKDSDEMPLIIPS